MSHSDRSPGTPGPRRWSIVRRAQVTAVVLWAILFGAAAAFNESHVEVPRYSELEKLVFTAGLVLLVWPLCFVTPAIFLATGTIIGWALTAMVAIYRRRRPL